MKVKLDSDNESHLIFHRWLPRERECLIFRKEPYNFRLWLDIDCLGHVSGLSEDDIARTINVMAHSLHVEVEVLGVELNLLSYIRARGEKQNFDRNHRASESFNNLASDLYTSTIEMLNTFIHVVRVDRGQHWVKPITPQVGNAMSFYVGSNAVVSSTDFGPVRWDPPLDSQLNIEISSSDMYISPEDWQRIQDGMIRKPDNALVREFVTYAEQLNDEGHYRASLIQGVSALELAVNQFLNHPREIYRERGDLRKDFDSKGLGELGDKLGLRGTFAILIPLLFIEDEFSSELLGACKKAIQTRGTVVHKGQRKLDRRQVWQYLKAVREAVMRLEVATDFGHRDDA